jgi:hypothetical protein
MNFGLPQWLAPNFLPHRLLPVFILTHAALTFQLVMLETAPLSPATVGAPGLQHSMRSTHDNARLRFTPYQGNPGCLRIAVTNFEQGAQFVGIR